MYITDEGEAQSVKTQAGVRKVPIHGDLIRLGFLEYVMAQKAIEADSLWPMLPIRKDQVGGYFSQWFGVNRKALGFGQYPDFHCFRHTVCTLMAEADISENDMDALVGHEAKGSTGSKVYTHRTMKTPKKAIDSLHYPFLALPRVFTAPAAARERKSK